MDSQTETFIVQETQPMWPGEKPMPFITVNGKMSYVPHRWGAKPGDVITITRKGQENDAIVGRVSEVLATATAIGRRAAKLCRERGVEIGTVADERHGSVKSYPSEIIDAAEKQVQSEKATAKPRARKKA